jgi:hypothetical protein
MSKSIGLSVALPFRLVERRLWKLPACFRPGQNAMTHSFGALLLPSVIAALFAANPASSATYADCKAHAINMSGDARQKFMNSCLGGTAEETPNCVNGRPCSNSCIAKDKVCPK